MIGPAEMEVIGIFIDLPWWVKLLCYLGVVIVGGFMIVPTKTRDEIVSNHNGDTISEIIRTMDKGYLETMDHESMTFIYPPHSTAFINECIEVRSAGFPTEINREAGKVKVYIDRQERRMS